MSVRWPFQRGSVCKSRTVWIELVSMHLYVYTRNHNRFVVKMIFFFALRVLGILNDPWVEIPAYIYAYTVTQPEYIIIF